MENLENDELTYVNQPTYVTSYLKIIIITPSFQLKVTIFDHEHQEKKTSGSIPIDIIWYSIARI